MLCQKKAPQSVTTSAGSSRNRAFGTESTHLRQIALVFVCVCLERGRLTDDMTGEGQQEHGVEYAERICEGQMYYRACKRRPSKPEKHKERKGRMRKRLK